MRLDEILLQKGKLTEEQISIALNHQKTFGGKFGTHILHHGFVDEADLVEALSQHFGARGVTLSNCQIPQSVVDMIPANLAYSRNIIPFDYDAQRDLLYIACEDPTDEALLAEIKYVVSASAVELCVRVEIAPSSIGE